MKQQCLCQTDCGINVFEIDSGQFVLFKMTTITSATTGIFRSTPSLQSARRAEELPESVRVPTGQQFEVYRLPFINVLVMEVVVVIGFTLSWFPVTAELTHAAWLQKLIIGL